MRRSRAKGQRKLAAYIGYPVLFIAVTALLYLAGGKLLVSMTIDEFKQAAIQGAPEYQYEDISQLEDKQQEGAIKIGEVRLPSVGTQFGQIACEKIGLNAPVYYGDSEEILEAGAGIYVGSSLPGQGSVILTGGHDTTFFEPLSRIGVGDVLAVSTTYGEFTYKVTAMTTADIMDTTAYQPKTTKETMILYTCYPFGQINTNRTQRYYVYAEKVTGPELREE